MKTNFTHSNFIIGLLFMAGFLPSLRGYAQPDYDFRNHILLSGADMKTGAVYLFPSVRPGVDAIMTLTHISNGITVSEMDGSSGYPEALQPTLVVDPFTSGYLEMQFQFVVSGTSTPSIQTEVPVTCIDVDGWADNDGLGNPLYEFDAVDLGGGYVDYQLTGGELTMWQAGTWFNGKNNGGLDYPGRDTTARQVMFTAVNGNISSFGIRVGVDNQSSVAVSRLRSVYFKKFFYPSSVLSKSSLLSFQGLEKEQMIDLQWKITQHDIKTVVVEKGNGSPEFSAIGEIASNVKGGQIFYHYQDPKSNQGDIYYRLKIISVTGKITYSSIIVFYSKAVRSDFKIYPSIFKSSAIIQLKSEKLSIAQFQLVDYSGRIAAQKNILVQAGTNNIVINDLANIQSGSYLAIVRLNKKIYNQKMFKP
jgi:hypothetical protein